MSSLEQCALQEIALTISDIVATLDSKDVNNKEIKIRQGLEKIRTWVEALRRSSVQ